MLCTPNSVFGATYCSFTIANEDLTMSLFMFGFYIGIALMVVWYSIKLTYKFLSFLLKTMVTTNDKFNPIEDEQVKQS